MVGIVDTVLGMTREDIRFLEKWSGQRIDYCSALKDALGDRGWGDDIERLSRISAEWYEMGGIFPITEKQIVFAPQYRARPQ